MMRTEIDLEPLGTRCAPIRRFATVAIENVVIPHQRVAHWMRRPQIECLRRGECVKRRHETLLGAKMIHDAILVEI